MSDLRDESIDRKGVILNTIPSRAWQGFSNTLMQLVCAIVLLDHALEGCNLKISRVTGPLEDLKVENRGHIFHGCSRQHLAGQVE